MGLLSWFSNQDRIPEAVAEATAAITPQLSNARKKYKSDRTFEDSLLSNGTVLLVHGFIVHFVDKKKIRGPHLIWAANVLTFEQSFGRKLGSEMVLLLQKALHDSDAALWIKEGRNAARDFDRDGLPLLAAFLEGKAT